MGRQVSSAKNRPFTVKIILPFDETVEIADIVTSMSILALKDRVELATGIPRYDFRKYKVNNIKKKEANVSSDSYLTSRISNIGIRYLPLLVCIVIIRTYDIGSVSNEDLAENVSIREKVYAQVTDD